MVLKGLVIVLKVEVGIAQLAVNGTKRFEVICSSLNRCLEKLYSGTAVAGFAQAFSL